MNVDMNAVAAFSRLSPVMYSYIIYLSLIKFFVTLINVSIVVQLILSKNFFSEKELAYFFDKTVNPFIVIPAQIRKKRKQSKVNPNIHNHSIFNEIRVRLGLQHSILENSLRLQLSYP